MKTAIIIVLTIGLIVAIYEAIKYRMALTVLSAWCAENNYETPKGSDIERITKRVAKKMFAEAENEESLHR